MIHAAMVDSETTYGLIAGRLRLDIHLKRAHAHYPAPAASAKRANAGSDFEPVFLHDRGAMVLNSALADAKIRGNNFVRLACENRFHDLALSLTEASDLFCRSLPPNQQLVLIPRLFKSSPDADDQFTGIDRLLDEVRSGRLQA
jgi:hypothetical protein